MECVVAILTWQIAITRSQQMPGFLSATFQSGNFVEQIFSKSGSVEDPGIADTFAHISIRIFDAVFQAITVSFHQLPDFSWVLPEEGRSMMKEKRTNFANIMFFVSSGVHCHACIKISPGLEPSNPYPKRFYGKSGLGSARLTPY